ncbi:uncharacterized protein LOC129877517 isoform X2 [Solanum dulcamara]|uniref:uncharacterized protein LOC129877517 isoform X2 n=1 Tax=Solanum dulcamara TaxID=45834 RepID=UPI0024863B92|nr:uncharacterized protein LOC129877517 isoform X2 [Solanum dulcamara]
MDTALFSPSSLFGGSDSNSSDEENSETQQNFVERRHQFPEMELLIQEFSFHQMNANLLWPGTFAFAEWLAQHTSWLRGRRIIELDIEENIAHNCQANGVSPALPHIRHSWGDVFPVADPDWDLIIASDILLYVKQYENLVKTLCFLLKSYKPKVDETGSGTSEEKDICPLPQPAFLMSWRRRIGKEDESLFFTGCEKAGLEVNHLGSRVYCIKPNETSAIEAV